MSSILTSGIAWGCNDNFGGVQEFYINLKSEVTAYNIEDDGTITVTNSSPFYRFVSNKNTGSFTQDVKIAPENANKTVEVAVTMQFGKLEKTKADTLTILACSPVVIIAKTFDNKYFYLGRDRGLDLMETSANSGTQSTDFTGYILNFNGVEKELALEMTEAAVTALLS